MHPFPILFMPRLKGLLLLLALFSVLTMAAAVYHGLRLRSEALTHHRNMASSLTRVGERELTSTLSTVERLLARYGKNWHGLAQSAQSDKELRDDIAKLPALRSISLIDADGRVLASSLPGARGKQLSASAIAALLDALRHFRDELKPLSPAQAVFQHSFAYTTAPCIEACPSKIDVPKYIDGVKGGKFDFALGVILEKYSMAATCGRVCVRFCEDACRRAGAEGAVGIRMLKRYAADQALANKRLKFTRPSVQHPQRVAVIGAGPAGITCAYKLLLDGFQVDVFDAQQASGGMASIGIPSYRLPKDVVKAESEDIIRQLGGNFFYGKVLGRDFALDTLLASGYDAVFLGYGASQGTTLGVRNEEQKPVGYASGVDFLLNVHKHVEYGEPFAVEGDVVVVGGGNVAMDCVRSARRMGARSVHLVYRRTVEDMPAEHDEIHAAEEEGVIFHCLSNPSALVIENGKLQGVELVQMRQTELDAKGRRSVEPIPGSESFMKCDLLIAAIGQQVDTLLCQPVHTGFKQPADQSG